MAGGTLTGWGNWKDFINLDSASWILLVLLSINTLLAYGALSEAIHLIPLSIVTVITTTNPLITLLIIYSLNHFRDKWLFQELIGVIGYSGALFIVLGVSLIVYKSQQG